MPERLGVGDCFGPLERMGFRIMGFNETINRLTQLPGGPKKSVHALSK
jgi:hypothetical protein